MEQKIALYKHPLWIAAIVFLLVAFFMVIILGKSEEPSEITQNDTSGNNSKTIDSMMKEIPLTGKIGLSIKGGQSTIKKGDMVTLFLFADSINHDVTAYDADIRFNSSKLKVNDIKPLVDNMDIYETEEELENGLTEYIVTGVKGLSYDGPFVFKNTALAEITFTALESGPVDVFPFLEYDSSRDSNLYDNSNKDILSHVEGVTLTIE